MKSLQQTQIEDFASHITHNVKGGRYNASHHIPTLHNIFGTFSNSVVSKILTVDFILTDGVEYDEKGLEKHRRIRGDYHNRKKKINVFITDKNMEEGIKDNKDIIMTLVHELKHYIDDIKSDGRYSRNAKVDRIQNEIHHIKDLSENTVRNLYLLLPYEVSAFMVMYIYKLKHKGVKRFVDSEYLITMKDSFRTVLGTLKRMMDIYDQKTGNNTFEFFLDEKSKRSIIKVLYSVWLDFNKQNLDFKKAINEINMNKRYLNNLLLLWINEKKDVEIYYTEHVITMKDITFITKKLKDVGVDSINFINL